MFKHRLPIEPEVLAASKKLQSVAPSLTKAYQMLLKRIKSLQKELEKGEIEQRHTMQLKTVPTQS
jgi:hypothetical protein